MFQPHLNNIFFSRNYLNIDFALRCMDVLATKSNLNELKFDVRFYETEAEDAQATFLIFLA